MSSSVPKDAPIRLADVVAAHNAMAPDYDEMDDLWYPWIFSVLHHILLTYLSQYAAVGNIERCLDVGCGTGLQSCLLGLCGWDVNGIDPSEELLRKAMAKHLREYLEKDLFDSPYEFTKKYGEDIRALAAQIRGNRPVGQIVYETGVAEHLPFEDDTFDLLSCCGSTLSMVEDYSLALSEFRRVLKPGGLLLLEVENKYNCDLVFPLWDAVVDKIAGYMRTIRADTDNGSGVNVASRLASENSQEATTLILPIRLFASWTLESELKELGFLVKKMDSIHCVTNIIPSPILHPHEDSERTSKKSFKERIKFGYRQNLKTVLKNVFSSPRTHIKIDYPFEIVRGAKEDEEGGGNGPSTALKCLFSALSKVDALVSTIPPFRHFGNSLIVICELYRASDVKRIKKPGNG